ncbi:MAG: beta-L-arabinofuranosidase domain-containing protein [Armatimonadota bacterium]
MLERFDYKGVTLHDGNFKRQFDEVRDFYLRLPCDDLLRGYRIRAGRPAPGVELGGCYLRHNTFGQVMSGLARMFAATGDAACKAKALALMHGWAECIEPDGYFMIEKKSPLLPYQFDKMLVGLLDVYVYCKDKDALKHMHTITDWAIKNMSREKPYARPDGAEVGEWYTLSENLYRAYFATGDTKFRDFGKVWEYKEFWDLFTSNSDIFQHPMNGGWYHAYSHVNSFNSLAAAYAVNKNPVTLQTLKNAYEFMWSQQLWATGGYGPGECLIPRKELVGWLTKASNHFETQCGSWAVFKMCKYLTEFTGDAKYGDWTELMCINAIGASIPMDADGSVFYYSEYELNGSSKKNVAPWACCSGTRPQAVADFHDIIYYKDKSDIYVNLFVPSSVELNGVTLTQNTRFPETAGTELVVSTEKPMALAISIRNPGWLSSPMKIKLNGKPIEARVDATHWVTVRRTWNDGDTLSVELPMSFSLSSIDPEKPYPTAVMYGPVTMASRMSGPGILRSFDLKHLSSVLKPVEAEPLNFRVADDPSVLVRPFYQYKAGEKYFVYLNIDQNVRNVPNNALKYSSGWTDYNQWMTSNTPGTSVDYRFTGTGIRLYYALYDDAGQLEVSVDGQKLGVVDEYGPYRGKNSEQDFKGLEKGAHTLTMTVLPSKSPDSKGTFVNIAGLTVFE